MLEAIPLYLIIFLPIIGMLAILLLARSSKQIQLAKIIAMITSLITLGLSVRLAQIFNYDLSSLQLIEKYSWVSSSNFDFKLAIDGISLSLIMLTSFLTPVCILASWHSITKNIALYLMSFLLLESCVIGVFCAADLISFYVFFEAMLIPMFLIIGIWGGSNRIYAAYKFFLYTLAGSVFLLIAIIYIYNVTKTTDIVILMQQLPSLPLEIQRWLWLGFMISFAIKIPMWPVHTWLPDAHVQAPTAGSVILAGILLKIGGYGFVRFLLPMFPQASQYFAPLIYSLSCVAIIYASLLALVQTDMKKLIAYSSIAHMGFVTIGIFSFNIQGLQGAMVQMISHGLVSGALFLCIGVLYDRMHSREISDYGGVANVMPNFAMIMMFFTMAAVGLPGTSGFVGEILVLVGAFKQNMLVATFATSGLVLGAAYMLLLYKKVMFGEIINNELHKLQDLTKKELWVFTPIVISVLLIGIYPKVITNMFNAPLTNIIKEFKKVN